MGVPNNQATKQVGHASDRGPTNARAESGLANRGAGYWRPPPS